MARLASTPHKGYPAAAAGASMGLFGTKKGDKDPVCGMTVDRMAAAGKWEHDHTTYWFCSTSCLGRFRDAPDKYLP